MIFQSQIPSTSTNSKQQGIIYMLLGAALILLIAIIVKFPVPEVVAETPVIYMNFGESETGGPAMENSSGDGGGENSPQPQNNAPNENDIDAVADPGKENAPAINNNKSKNTTTNTSQTVPQVEKNSGFKSNKKGSGGPAGNGNSPLPGGGGEDDKNKGNLSGRKDGNGHLLDKYRPRQINQFAFSYKESDQSTIRLLRVILTVDCKGIVKNIEIARGSKATEDFAFIKSQLRGNKFYDARSDCDGPAKWEVDVTITP
ncbi:MAG: hypothetical protein SGJ10_10660 [Bacteroidota bacterium]|nr:hypothetical protein [Bacteroidota bacterium]